MCFYVEFFDIQGLTENNNVSKQCMEAAHRGPTLRFVMCKGWLKYAPQKEVRKMSHKKGATLKKFFIFIGSWLGAVF